MPHLARTHPRLTIATLLGLAAGALVPISPVLTKVLIGWNTAVWTYLNMMLWLTTRPARKTQRFVEREDENAGTVLLIVSIAAIASLAAITAELAGGKNLMCMPVPGTTRSPA